MSAVPVEFPKGPRAAPALAAMHEMTAVRITTGTVLEGEWQGHELNDYRVKPSQFSGAHYILQLGHTLPVGGDDADAVAFRPTFIVRYPIEPCVGLENPEVRADAERVAQAFMHMLNLRRKKE